MPLCVRSCPLPFGTLSVSLLDMRPKPSSSHSLKIVRLLMNTLKPLLTVKRTAEILNTCEKTVRRRITEGDLPAIRDRRTVRIHPDDLERYIRARRNG